MKLLLVIAGMICVLGSSCAGASPPSGTAAAPPMRCEIRLSAWCIAEGSYEVTRQLASDRVHDRIWSIRGKFRPDSKLVILEPNGCKSGYSDVLELSGFDRSIEWQSHSWDRLRIKLKSDGSCDLTVLLPPYDGDPMEWAFTSGLTLVRACKNDACENASFAQLKSQFEQKFRNGRTSQ